MDLLLTSPPYFILRKYEGGDPFQIGHEKTKEEYCENVTRVIRELVITLKESGNVLINIGETFDNNVGYGIPQLLKHYIETKTTLIYKDTLIWSKPNPKPQNETILRPINNVEYLLWFVVDPKKEHIVVDEANNVSVPVIALIDSDSDPRPIKFVIPGNDDAVRSIKFFVDQIAAAYKAGRADRK